MTYPAPSKKYGRDLVCTAGILESGDWVRLYPIDYRYLPPSIQFHKYQWIEVALADRGSGNDRRKESRRPNLETLRVIGEPLSTRNNWRARREIIDRMPHHTVSQLEAMYESDRVSIGIVRPTRILDMVIEEAEPDWKPEWQAELRQFRLFGVPLKPLRKIPYKFSYVFECEEGKKEKRMIADWELGVLFLRMADEYGSDEKAAEMVKKKFFNELCDSSRDTRFFMGTRFPWNTWIIYGVFWPPKEQQQTLF
jgi:hypothetical protein